MGSALHPATMPGPPVVRKGSLSHCPFFPRKALVPGRWEGMTTST